MMPVVERPSSYAATHKMTRLWRGGGWAVTLKSAAARGKPTSLADPSYCRREVYIGAMLRRLNVESGYHDAVRARYRQVGR